MLDIKETIQFCSDIEIMARANQITYTEAILTYINENQIDVETVPKLLTPALKQKIEDQAHALNLLGKKPQKLPFS